VACRLAAAGEAHVTHGTLSLLLGSKVSSSGGVEGRCDTVLVSQTTEVR
jgi:hypothetical protein